jgi:hypothetical protein
MPSMAVASPTGSELDAVAAAFAALGYILLAVEAAAARRSAGYRARAGVSAARVRALGARRVRGPHPGPGHPRPGEGPAKLGLGGRDELAAALMHIKRRS